MPYVTVDVDVDIEDVIDEMNEAELRMVERRLRRIYGDHDSSGDPTSERIIERAFLVAKQMPNLPKELVDLFLKVHGRAIA